MYFSGKFAKNEFSSFLLGDTLKTFEVHYFSAIKTTLSWNVSDKLV